MRNSSWLPGTASRLHVAAFAGVAVALVVLFACEVRSAGLVAIDDAFITFAFSKNLALGHGPVYGHGVRVEGYSNFLWMLIVAAGLRVRTAADPLSVARIAAVPFMLLLVASTYWLCRLRAGRVLSLAAAAMLVINLDVVTSFLIGLETTAYAALLTFAFALYAHSVADQRSSRWVVPTLVAVALTRIDGFAPLAFILAFEAVRRLVTRQGTWRDYARWAGPGVAVYGAWFLWRWSYYGLPLPSTYYAKALIPTLLPERGLEYVIEECRANGWWLGLPFAAVVLARRRPACVAVVLYAALHVLYVIKVGGDWMPYGRFLLPLLPLVLASIAWGGTELVELSRRRLDCVAPLLFAAPALVFVLVALKNERHLLRDEYHKGNLGLAAEQGAHVMRLKAAAWFLRFAVPSGARMVTDYGGVLAYYTAAAPIEMWGLCNALIATKGSSAGVNPIYGKTCPACYAELDPEIFHTTMPMVRTPDALRSHDQVVRQVWQTDTIGRYLDFQRNFVSGRVLLPARNQALFFLEKRRPGARFTSRTAGDGVLVDYPFEPGGRAAGL